MCCHGFKLLPLFPSILSVCVCVCVYIDLCFSASCRVFCICLSIQHQKCLGRRNMTNPVTCGLWAWSCTFCEYLCVTVSYYVFKATLQNYKLLKEDTNVCSLFLVSAAFPRSTQTQDRPSLQGWSRGSGWASMSSPTLSGLTFQRKVRSLHWSMIMIFWCEKVFERSIIFYLSVLN